MLVRQAQDDPAALDELRAVDAVDGQTVDIAGALSGARGAALAARLAELERSTAGAAQGNPRADAKDVLAQDRFHEKSVPGPFKGLIDRLGEPRAELRLARRPPPRRQLGDVDRPRGRPRRRRLAGRAAVALAAGAGRRAGGRGRGGRARRGPEAPRPPGRRRRVRRRSRTALRLRFRAGLLRLDRRGAIYFRPSISTREVQRALRSKEFDGLAATFDDVVHGGRAPAPEDIAAGA